MSRRRGRQAALVVATALAVTGISGTAWAYYVGATATTASGTAGVTNTVVQAVTVEAVVAGDLTGIALLPGGSADIVMKVNNPNSFPMVVTVATNGAVALVGGNVAACTTHGVTATVPAASQTVPAGSSTIRVTGGASMSTAAQTGCQGATFRVPVTMTSRTSGAT